MRKFITFILSSILFIALTSFIFTSFLNFKQRKPMYDLSKGWVVTYKNQQYQNTDISHLSDQLGLTFARGDKITLNRPNPIQKNNADFPYLVFKSQHCAYEVYLDGDRVAYENLSATTNGSFIGTGYNIIPLKKFEGKKLTIILYVAENDTRINVTTPLLADFNDIYRKLLYTAAYPLLTGMFLIVFGHIFLLISLVLYMRSSGVFTQIICSLIVILLGIWLLTTFDCTAFLVSKDVTTFMSYLSLYLIVPCVYLLIYNLHKQSNFSVVAVLGISSFAFSVFFTVLHLLNKVHIHHFLMPHYILSVISFLALIIYNIKDFKSKTRNASTQIIMLGVSSVSLSLLLSAFMEVTKRDLDCRDSVIMNFMIPSAALFFVITQLLNHFVFMTKFYAQRKEYASLAQLAYEDALTRLPNRASCDMKLNELEHSDDDFCIVSLDLNGLKQVNDNDGHPAGDKLIKSFADALSKVFSRKGDCFRTGGDEFLAIFDSIDRDELDDLLRKLDNLLLELDEKDPDVNHSVSYGYAFRSETEEQDVHSVFMLADKKMYDAKRKHYAEIGKER